MAPFRWWGTGQDNRGGVDKDLGDHRKLDDGMRGAPGGPRVPRTPPSPLLSVGAVSVSGLWVLGGPC